VKRLQIYIDEEVDEALAAAVVETGTSKAALIREALRNRSGGAEEEADPVDSLVGSLEGEAGEVDEVVYPR
jgi:hypothetical protein